MSQLSKKLLSLFLFLLSISPFSSQLMNTENIKLPKDRPNDFNFILTYGYGGINKLDTLNGKYTKDLISDPPITIDLKLSEDEMDVIYKDMKSIDILKYPEIFNPEGNAPIRPNKTYSLKIFINGKEKDIYWNDETLSSKEEAMILRNLFEKIHEILSEKDDYKKLPPPKGGYK